MEDPFCGQVKSSGCNLLSGFKARDITLSNAYSIFHGLTPFQSTQLGSDYESKLFNETSTLQTLRGGSQSPNELLPRSGLPHKRSFPRENCQNST